MSTEDMERELLSRDTKTAKILKYFKEHSEDIITVDDLLDAIEVQYSTAWGTICRLNKMGLIEKKGRGRYVYLKGKAQEDTGIFFPDPEALGIGEKQDIIVPKYDEIEEKIRPTQEAIDTNIENNLKEFYEEENERIKSRALINLRTISQLYDIKDNKKLWDLVDKLPNEIDINFQWQIVRLIQNMINFEKRKEEKKVEISKVKDIIEKSKKPLIDTLISESADQRARTDALDILIENLDQEIFNAYLKIIKMEEENWNTFAYSFHRIIEIIKDTKEFRRLFLNEIEKLYRDDDEKLYRRGEEIYDVIRKRYYKEFFLLD